MNDSQYSPTPQIPDNPVTPGDPVYTEFQRLVNGGNPDTTEWSAIDWFKAGTLYKQYTVVYKE